MKEIQANTEQVVANKRQDLGSGKKIILNTDLDVELDGISFHLVTHDNSAVVKFDRLSDSLALFKRVRKLSSLNPERAMRVKSVLQNSDITLYLQNKHIGLFGPKAGTIMPRLLGLFTS